MNKVDYCNAHAGKVFRRLEKKYLMTEKQRDQFLKICCENIKKSKYFSSTVNSIYYDTKNDDLIIKQIDKPIDRPIFREKVRLRAYNTPRKDDYIFFEIKTKIKDDKVKIGDKRRFQLLLSDLEEWENGETSLVDIAKRKVEKSNDEQIAREIEYIVSYLDLEPKIFIACERECYEAIEDPMLRITIDSGLRFREKKLKLDAGSVGKLYFNDDRNIIMEIKANRGMPFWLVRALNELKLYPQAFSKYGKIYQKMKGEKNVQYHL